MAPVPHAVALQRSRTQNTAWRHTNQSLIRGGAMTLQAKSRQGDMPSSSVFPSWRQPLTSLLSPQPSVESLHQSPQLRPSARSTRSATRHRRTSELLSVALRDRVASTENLSETLRNECLERLDQITIPQKMRRRPSWTHLEDSVDRSDAKDSNIQRVDEVAPDLVPDTNADYETDEVVTSEAVTQPRGDRAAAMNFLKEFHAMPTPPISELRNESESGIAISVPLSKAKKHGEPHQHHLQEQCRYKKLWSVEDRDLSKSAAVWKSTAKSSTRSPPSCLASPLRLPEVGALVVGAKGVAAISQGGMSAFSSDHAKRALEAARSATQIGQHIDPQTLVEEAPRGKSSLLRTTLRYAVQA